MLGRGALFFGGGVGGRVAGGQGVTFRGRSVARGEVQRAHSVRKMDRGTEVAIYHRWVAWYNLYAANYHR